MNAAPNNTYRGPKGSTTDWGTALWTVGLALLLALGWSTTAQAQPECDVPLIVQQGSVAPNVLIVLDSSGSMNHFVRHEAYDETVLYPGNFTWDRIYYTSTTREYTPSSWNSNYPSHPRVMLATADMGQSGRYLGNYLNWIYFHATDEQRLEIPQVTRMQAGRAAVNLVMQQARGLRYGLMTFNGSTGGYLRAHVGTDPATLEATVNGIVATGWTPSAETLVTALKSFTTDDEWIEYKCQQSFIVFVTDGEPTQDTVMPPYIGDQDGDGREPGNCESIGSLRSNADKCTDYMDDVAYYLANTDLRDDLEGDQHVYTYTIGFGIDMPLLEETAINGQGSYHNAWNLQTLTQSLGTVIGDIVARISAGAAVAVVSTEQSGEGMLFRGKFMPGLWQGYFEGHNLPYENGQAARWEAGSILANRSPYDRNVFTNVGVIGNFDVVPFTPDAAEGLAPWMEEENAEEAERTIRYVLGDDVEGARDRNGWKLGDLVYSTPVVVGKPSYFYSNPEYQQFLIDNLDREPVAYIGSNDGMLHAFRASDGRELWGFVPRDVLPNLKDLKDPEYCHTTFVDLSPEAFDAYIDGQWRTILIGGLRTGGDSYFCLDVSDPYSPTLLWESDWPEIYSSFTEAEIVHTRFGSYLWTGSGPDPAGDAVVCLFSLEDGFPFAWSTYSIMPGKINMASAPSAVDRDFDGFVDVIYQADLAGNLWRCDMSDPNGFWYWSILFDTPDGQPIQTRPTLAMNEEGEVIVFFGTGQYINSGDITSAEQQTFYAIRDDETVYDMGLGHQPWHVGDLVDQTSSIHDMDDAQGWYIRLNREGGERVIEPAVVLDGVVYFTSFSPNSQACSAGGRSWLYHVDFLDGSTPEDEDDEGDNNGGTDNRYESLGEGVASRAVVNLGDGSLVVQTSDARLSIRDLQVEHRPMMVHAWRQTFDGMNAAGEVEGEQQQQ